MKVVIIYGSTTGNTETAASSISNHFSGSEVIEVGSVDFSSIEADLIIMGSSTWGIGDLQDDWEGKIGELKGADLSGKKVALFGTGDQFGYGSSFIDAMGKIYHAVKSAGGEVIGFTPTDSFEFEASEAVIDGRFCGLGLDYDNNSGDCDDLIAKWADQLKSEI